MLRAGKRLQSGAGLMKIPTLLLVFFSGAVQAADGSALPPEVRSYIEERELCEHFRQEPFEGNAPEQVERRAFLQASVEIHCAGTDRRLFALRKRYAGTRSVLSRLEKYEIDSEVPCP